MSKALYPLVILSMLLSVAGCKKDFEENKVPVADAGQSKTITLPDSAVVSGSGTDADGKVVAYLWSQVSGPANSIIVNPGATSTIIRYTVPGSYLFQLMVTDDNGATGVDTVSVLVTGSKIEGNKIPVANAGPSKTVTLPDSAVVTGTGTDVDGKVVAYLWSQISGPASSTIVNPGSPSTSFQFSAAGSYIFQLLVVDDKGATGVDTMSVLVKPLSQQTLTLQPYDNRTEYQVVTLNGSDVSGWGPLSFDVVAWTSSGNAYNFRSLLKFDFSSIPTGATIKSAHVFLYSHPTPTPGGNFVDANSGPTNAFLVQQITTPWTTSTATWANQPSVSTSNQIVVPHTSQTSLDVDIDVTAMVASMVNNNTNYGFFFRLQNEVIYNIRSFVSSRNTTYPNKRPKIVITYQ
jgi:hypothetical protein